MADDTTKNDFDKLLKNTRVPLPVPSEEGYIHACDKKYCFNATGNIMLVTTDQDTAKIEKQVRDVFNEVSVFFAGMTKAISEIKNPDFKNNNLLDEYYNLYHYDAIRQIIDRSGLFVQVNQTAVSHNVTSGGATFSKELLQGLLGLAVGPAGAVELEAFANTMISNVSKEGLKLGFKSETAHKEVGNIIFVCEYLLGMPLVTAIVLHIDSNKIKEHVEVGPCIKVDFESFNIEMHKDSYMFVLPKYIKKYAPDLMSGEFDPTYLKFVSSLKRSGGGLDTAFVSVNKTGETTPITSFEKGLNYDVLIRNLDESQKERINLKLGTSGLFDIDSVSPPADGGDTTTIKVKTKAAFKKPITEIQLALEIKDANGRVHESYTSDQAYSFTGDGN